MTTDEAMQAVNKAVGVIPYLEARVNLSNRNPKRPDGETIEEILLAALRAIAPDGPLAVVPKEHLEYEQQKFCDETLRTSALSQMLIEWADHAKSSDHEEGPWSRSCRWCQLHTKTRALLKMTQYEIRAMIAEGEKP